jgi:hypothetical protein
MSGHVDAPSGTPRQFPIPVGTAERLALYSVAEGPSVLAPRGWNCYEIYGSDGAFLVVSPLPVSVEAILAMRRPAGYTQPVVILSLIDGFTSGRDEVSPVVNRVFPKHREFVADAAANMDQPIPRFKGPFAGDRLHYLSSETVEYTTPAHREGLGTLGFLRPSALPITGVEILEKEGGDCCDLTSLAIRLAPGDAALGAVIRQQVEREATMR